MFRVNLILRRKGEDVMSFSPAPWFRILFLFFTAMILIGIFTVSPEETDGSLVGPIIVITACVLASLYEESWSFDRKERTVKEKRGFILLHKTRTWSFDDIEDFELKVFLRGAESDGSADHEINLTKAFSRENTEEAAGRSTKIIHKRYQQILQLNLKSGEIKTIESLAARDPEALKKKAEILAEFSGIRLSTNQD